ncbi:unnamed protein product [Dovyalis caffra]|uniref:Uncharacterized protein n=1 Tax=Dovyalis caffra TaxID=77055 RepID=A0AAV1QS14_9ROSI|nr:unnamed protein product [Dovyalis caffra]
MAASAKISDGDHDAVELIVCLCDALASAPAPDEISSDGAVSDSEEITPLLKPKINIFSLSHSRRKPRELKKKAEEACKDRLRPCDVDEEISGVLSLALDIERGELVEATVRVERKGLSAERSTAAFGNHIEAEKK